MFIYPYYTWITQNPPALPKLYWGTISQEQRIARICKTICGLEGYMAYLSKSVIDLQDEIRDDVQDIIDEARAEIDDALAGLRRDVYIQIQDLRKWVEEQTLSQSIWDVTRGLSGNSIDVMRRTFFDVTVEGTTVDHLATSKKYPTVDTLANSGWNCRSLAVIGATVLDETYPNQWRVA